jgi:DNA-binding transcriptional regulator YiaG
VKTRSEEWDARSVRALRERLGLSQGALADELGMRQQTVSEWETGRYRPRGGSARLLGMIAERAGFEYVAQSRPGRGKQAENSE